MSRRTRGPRKDYTWNGATLDGSGITTTQSVQAAVTFNASGTVARARGRIKAYIDNPSDGDRIYVGAGLIVVTEEQLAVGATATPNPLTDLDAEWMWHGFMPLAFETTTNTEASTLAMDVLEIDSKAMRRVKQTQSLALVVARTAGAGSSSISFVAGLRILLAE